MSINTCIYEKRNVPRMRKLYLGPSNFNHRQVKQITTKICIH